jgi:hypothetical protein
MIGKFTTVLVITSLCIQTAGADLFVPGAKSIDQSLIIDNQGDFPDYQFAVVEISINRDQVKLIKTSSDSPTSITRGYRHHRMVLIAYLKSKPELAETKIAWREWSDKKDVLNLPDGLIILDGEIPNQTDSRTADPTKVVLTHVQVSAKSEGPAKGPGAQPSKLKVTRNQRLKDIKDANKATRSFFDTGAPVAYLAGVPIIALLGIGLVMVRKQSHIIS